MNQVKFKKFDIETISAVFIVALVSFSILTNFVSGFIFPLFLVVIIIAFLIAFFYPRSGLYALVFLTFIFERFFTLNPIVIDRNEYKLYSLDIILAGILAGIIFEKIFFSRKVKKPFFLLKQNSNFSKEKNNRKIFSFRFFSFVFPRQIFLKFKKDKASFYLIAFIGVIIIYFLASVIIWGGNFSLAFSSLKNYGFYSLLYFVVIFLLNKEAHWARFLKFALAGAIGIIVFIFIGVVRGEGLWSEYTPLSTAGIRILAFPHAYYLSLALIFSLVWLVFQKNNFSRWFWLLLPFWIIGIVGSMMRHLWIGLFFSLILLFFILSRERKIALKKIFFHYLLIIVTLGTFVFYLSWLVPYSNISREFAIGAQVLRERAISLSNFEDSSIAWREITWKAAGKEYRKNPWRAMGLGKKIFIEMNGYVDAVEARSLHNSFLSLFAQTGIWGLGALGLFVWFSFKEVWKKIKTNQTNFVLPATLTILIFQLIIFQFQPYLETNLLGIFFWLNLGLMKAGMKF